MSLPVAVQIEPLIGPEPVTLPTHSRRFVAESKVLLRLAAPLVVAQLAQMAMSVVGTLMAGRIGVRALAAQGLGATTFTFVLIAGYGVMAGLDPHISRAVGEQKPSQVGHLLRQSLWLSLMVVLPLTALLVAAPMLLRVMGQSPNLMLDVDIYLRWTLPGLLPALVFSAYRSFFSAVNRAQIVMYAAIVANVLNWQLCELFVNSPRDWLPSGLAGIGLASVISRFTLVAILVLYGKYHQHFIAFRRGLVMPDRVALHALLRSGLPLGLQYGLEVTGFVLVTLWMGLLGDNVLAAHEVALNASAVAFQVPFAAGTAAAMRVGRAIGRKDPLAAQLAGWTAFRLGLVYSALSASILLFFAPEIARVYLKTADAPVLAMTIHFLAISAAFQVVDGGQAIGFGVLRGLDDTRMPVLFNVLGFFLLGLPFAYIGVFVLHGPPDRMWWGLTLALGTVAVLLALRFAVKCRQILAQASV